MAKVPVEFGEWRPDVALLDSQFASEVENVYVGLNSYRPFPGLEPFTSVALPTSPACGLYSARTTAGGWKIYAGSQTNLYVWSLAGWTDVTRSAGNYNVADGDLWAFEQFGQRLIAVQPNDDPQWIDIDSGTNFARLGVAPHWAPAASHVKTIGDFVVLSGLSSNNRKVQWSAINDSDGWEVGVSLSDEQEFPDGGPVQGVSGAEIGYAVQDRAIRTMQFLPGDTTFIFNFSRVLHDRGCISKYGFTCIGNNLYFVSEDGFYNVSGQQVQPIGADKINDWFLANSDIGRRNVVQAFSFVNKPRIAWAFHASSASQTYDRLIIFDWSNQRWTKVTEEAQVWATMASLGLDLDTTGTETGDALLDSAALSLDSFAYIGGRPLIGAINENGLLSSLSGPSLVATMETAERHLAPGSRAFVSDAYPLVDGAAESVAAGSRERLQDPIIWEAPMLVEITGSAAVYSSARLHRFRVRVPASPTASPTWSHGQGVLVEAQADGTVA